MTAQVALSFLLLFGAGLFVRSLQNLQDDRHRCRPRQPRVTSSCRPPSAATTRRARCQLYQQLLDRLSSSPGVKSAAYATVPILAGDEWDSTTSVEGHKATDGEDMQAFMNALSPGYFETMKIPVLEGRDFTRRRPEVRTRRSRSSTAASPSTSSRARARSASTSAAAADRRRSSTSRSSAWSPTRSTKGRARACAGRSSCRTGATTARCSTSARTGASSSAYGLHPQRGAAAGRGDAGLQREDARVAARRNAADRPADRAAVGGLRPARDACSRRSASTASWRSSSRGGGRSSGSGSRSARSRES